ncbi:MAG: hypothetical protein HND48_22070 [Chloroflexi bacterium]|nr:hypothetical protein [Chloroflexota bacterium]
MAGRCWTSPIGSSADAYYSAILQTLGEYADPAGHCHLLVAGGRKAMSIYAMLAASLLFRSGDRVWTLLSDEELTSRRGVFHIAPAEQHRVQARPPASAAFAPCPRRRSDSAARPPHEQSLGLPAPPHRQRARTGRGAHAVPHRHQPANR